MSSNLSHFVRIYASLSKLAWLFVLVLCSRPLVAQPGEYSHSTQTALYYLERARMMASLDFLDSALYLIDEAKCLTFDSAVLSKCFRIEGQILNRLNNFEAAEMALKTGLALVPMNHDFNEALLMQNLLGSIEVYRGNFENAFMHFDAAFDYSDQTSDKSGIATLFMNYGVLYYKMFDYEKAISFWLAALESNLSLVDEENCRVNLALAYTNLNHFLESSRILKAVSARVTSMGERDQLNLFYALGTLYDSIGNTDSARFYFERSYEISKSMDPRYAAESLLSLARISNKSSKLAIGEPFLNAAEQIARAQNFQDILLRCLWERIRLTNLKGDLSARIRAQEEYLSQRKIFFDINMSRIASVHTQRLLKESQARKRSINQERLEATATLAKMHQRFQRIILIIGLMLVALVILLVYRFRIITKQMHVLEEAVKTRMVYLGDKNSKLADVLTLRNKKSRRIQHCIDSLEYSFEQYRGV